MKVLSNYEFSELVLDQSPRLKAIAKGRLTSKPKGFLTLADVDTLITTLTYSADKKGAAWLKNLKSLATSGRLQKTRTGMSKYDDHVLKVGSLYHKGEIAFNIGDHIMLKENGKQGTVVDYIPEDKQFLVMLNPYELRSYEKKDLEKIAKKITKAQFGDSGGYQAPYHHSDRELVEAELADLEVDLRCAIRDNLPEDYIKQCKDKIDKLQRELSD